MQCQLTQKLPGGKAHLRSVAKYCAGFVLSTRSKRGSGLKEPGSRRERNFVQRRLKYSALGSRQMTKASLKRHWTTAALKCARSLPRSWHVFPPRHLQHACTIEQMNCWITRRAS